VSVKEATARIKINKLLEAAGWRFFADGGLPANIRLEPGVTIKTADLDALGQDFEKASKGFIDFLLLNDKGFPFIVLEAKAEDKSPLVGSRPASTPSRRTAVSSSCPTATCITSGTCSAAILTSSPASRRPRP
jgi:type I restriction enzyme R subunit